MNSLLNQNAAVYSLDLSALFAAFNERYPIENFPGFWRKMEELIRTDRLIMPEVAFDKALKDERVKEWVSGNKLRPYLRRPIDEPIQGKVGEILKEFPRLLDDRTGKSGDDPWVIALAMVSHNCIVVTEEKPTGAKHRPKIPDVCNEFEVPWIQLVELVQRENWVF